MSTLLTTAGQVVCTRQTKAQNHAVPDCIRRLSLSLPLFLSLCVYASCGPFRLCHYATYDEYRNTRRDKLSIFICLYVTSLSTFLNCLRRLMNSCTPKADVAGRQHLRSASQRKLIVPRCRLNSFGRHCFAVAGASTWNSLPDSLRGQG